MKDKVNPNLRKSEGIIKKKHGSKIGTSRDKPRHFIFSLFMLLSLCGFKTSYIILACFQPYGRT